MGHTRDQVNLTTTKQAGCAAMAVVTAIQDRVPKRLSTRGDLLAGLGISLLLLCDDDVSPAEVLQVAHNLMYDGKKRRPEVRGAADYINKEILQRG